LAEEHIAGFDISRRVLVTWGDRFARRLLPGGKVIWSGLHRPGGFREGGCLTDIDADGEDDIVLNERESGDLVWLSAPDWRAHVIDRRVHADDIGPVTLFDRRGILLIHKHAQVRFYQIPQDLSQPWPYRDSRHKPGWPARYFLRKLLDSSAGQLRASLAPLRDQYLDRGGEIRDDAAQLSRRTAGCGAEVDRPGAASYVSAAGCRNIASRAG